MAGVSGRVQGIIWRMEHVLRLSKWYCFCRKKSNDQLWMTLVVRNSPSGLPTGEKASPQHVQQQVKEIKKATWNEMLVAVAWIFLTLQIGLRVCLTSLDYRSSCPERVYHVIFCIKRFSRIKKFVHNISTWAFRSIMLNRNCFVLVRNIRL